jgi:hypothetical protein
MFMSATDITGLAFSRHAACRHALLTAVAERRADARRLRRSRPSRATRTRI